jgi:DNA primase
LETERRKPRISEEEVQQIKDRIDILDVVSQFVDLKKKGATWGATSPWNPDEKTPSFFVIPKKSIFKDHSSGKGGDAFAFLKEHPSSQLEYRDALLWLAKHYNIDLPSQRQEQPTLVLKDRLLEINRFAQQYFSSNLFSVTDGGETTVAYDYLEIRGIRESTMRKFGLGYAEESYNHFLKAAKKAGYTNTELNYAGLINISKKKFKEKEVKYYDTFRHRAMFPIFNKFDQVVSFAGRYLEPSEKYKEERISNWANMVWSDAQGGVFKEDKYKEIYDAYLRNNNGKDRGEEAFTKHVSRLGYDKLFDPPPKYINGRNNTLFKKSRTLYGLNFAKKAILATGECIIIEGYMDVDEMHQNGIENTVASCGISFTDQHAHQLASMIREKTIPLSVTIMMDGDKAGQAANEAAIPPLLNQGFNVFVCAMPAPKAKGEKVDPHSFLISHESPTAAMEAMLSHISANRKPALNYVLDLRYNTMTEPQNRALELNKVCEMFANIPPESEFLIAEYGKQLAQATGQDPVTIISKINDMAMSRRNWIFKKRQEKQAKSETAKGERQLAKLLLKFGPHKTGRGSGMETFADHILMVVEEHDVPFNDRLVENLFDCCQALNADSRPLNVEELSKLNSAAAKLAEELTQNPLKTADLEPSAQSSGISMDMAFLLNMFKREFVNSQKKALQSKPDLTAEEAKLLVTMQKLSKLHQ